MTIKAVAVVSDVDPDTTNTGKFRAVVQFAGLDASVTLFDGSLNIDNIDPGILAVDLAAAVRQAVKDFLTNSYGYTFGLFDSVRVVGALA